MYRRHAGGDSDACAARARARAWIAFMSSCRSAGGGACAGPKVKLAADPGMAGLEPRCAVGAVGRAPAAGGDGVPGEFSGRVPDGEPGAAAAVTVAFAGSGGTAGGVVGVGSGDAGWGGAGGPSCGPLDVGGVPGGVPEDVSGRAPG